MQIAYSFSKKNKSKLINRREKKKRKFNKIKLIQRKQNTYYVLFEPVQIAFEKRAVVNHNGKMSTFI